MGIVTEKEPPLKLLGKEGADLNYWSFLGNILHNPMTVETPCSKCYSKSINVSSIMTGKIEDPVFIRVEMKAISTTEGIYYVGGCSECGTVYWGKGE